MGRAPHDGEAHGEGQKSTSAIAVQTPPNFNMFEKHMVGVFHFNLEKIGPAVVENDSCKVSKMRCVLLE